MPNPLTPPLLGLQKARSIGADPKAEQQTAAGKNMLYGSAPTPTDLLASLTSFGKLAVPALRRAAPVAETLGEMTPEFTPVGGEGLFNAARGLGNKATDAVESAYQRIMQQLPTRGR